jgi:hypothetical protein
MDNLATNLTFEAACRTDRESLLSSLITSPAFGAGKQNSSLNAFFHRTASAFMLIQSALANRILHHREGKIRIRSKKRSQ